VRISLSSDHSVYSPNQTPDIMAAQLSAIYRRERSEGERERRQIMKKKLLLAKKTISKKYLKKLITDSDSSTLEPWAKF